MSIFELYLKLGFKHIADINSYDHILFIITLCGVYMINQWKQILILVTAFTIGHSITLALATLNILNVPTAWVEFLIPVTILITAFSNFFHKSATIQSRFHNFKYFTALFFGLIHGLGFSSYLRSLLGSEENIISPLFAFNLGLEAGQLLIVSLLMATAILLINILGTNKRDWTLIISGAGFGVALTLILDRFPF